MRDLQTVLVVDDDERVLAGYQRGLQRTHTVLLAQTSETALELARQQRPDIAIVDLQLDNTSGIDLIRALKAERHDMFVVLVSGYASIDVAVAAMRAGADDVVPKPVTPREILRRVSDGGVDIREVETPTLERAQFEHVQRVLTDCEGNISLAARRLGVYRSTLQRWLRRHAPGARTDVS